MGTETEVEEFREDGLSSAEIEPHSLDDETKPASVIKLVSPVVTRCHMIVVPGTVIPDDDVEDEYECGREEGCNEVAPEG